MQEELDWLHQWTELVSSANSVAEFGRKLVHAPFTAQSAVGAHVYQLDSKGNIDLLGGYGLNPLVTDTKIHAWDDHVLANCIKSGKVEHQEISQDAKKIQVFTIAIMKGAEPLGAAAFIQREKAETLHDSANSAMSQVLGIWLQSLGLNKDWTGSNKIVEASPDDLTERQLKILEMMSLGKTNAEIAQELILSESSIRQETVKIYRALGVKSRSEAAKRAFHLGILRAPSSLSA